MRACNAGEVTRAGRGRDRLALAWNGAPREGRHGTGRVPRGLSILPPSSPRRARPRDVPSLTANGDSRYKLALERPHHSGDAAVHVVHAVDIQPRASERLGRPLDVSLSPVRTRRHQGVPCPEPPRALPTTQGHGVMAGIVTPGARGWGRRPRTTGRRAGCLPSVHAARCRSTAVTLQARCARAADDEGVAVHRVDRSGRRWSLREDRSLTCHPVGHALMGDAEVARDPAPTPALARQPHRQRAHLRRVAVRFGCRRIRAATPLTPVPLTP